MPPDAAVIDSDNFKMDISTLANEKIANAKRLQMKITSYTSTTVGISCDEMCSNIGNTCHTTTTTTTTNTTTTTTNTITYDRTKM